MSGIAFDLKLDDAALKRGLTSIVTFGPERTGPALEEIGEAMVSSTIARMNREEAPDGSKWKPSKRAMREGGTTLQKTRRLVRSIVSALLSSAAGVEWGTNVAYAAPNQLGALITKYAQSRPIYRKVKDGEILPGFVKKKRSNFETWHEQGEHQIKIPARPFIGFSADDQTQVAEILTRHLLAAMTGRAPGAAA